MADKGQIDIKRLNEILQDTINNIQNSKEEIEEIVEYSKNEHERLERELNSLKNEIKEQIEEVNRVEKLNKKHRLSLLNKSKKFDQYSEDEIKEAYDLVNQTRVILLLKREEEKNLIQRRSELELRLRNSFELYKKAENLNKQIKVATEYLLGNIDNITSTVEDLNEKYILGIKIIEAQEEERLRLARDIHDGPAQSLANVILKAELCEKLIEKDKEKTKDEIIELKNLTRDTLNNVRNVIYELRPMSLDDLGLVPTLEKYIDKFKGIKQILELEDNIAVIGQASNGEKGYEKALELKPDVILLDINMPNTNGIETLRKLKDIGIDSKIIMLTIHDDREYVLRTLNLGADGYIIKDSSADNFISAIHHVIEGKIYIQPRIAKLIGDCEKESARDINTEKINSLTKREYEVLTLIAEGLNNKHIASKMFISEKTVKNHVSKIFKKLELKDRVQATIFAFKNGIKNIEDIS